MKGITLGLGIFCWIVAGAHIVESLHTASFLHALWILAVCIGGGMLVRSGLDL